MRDLDDFDWGINQMDEQIIKVSRSELVKREESSPLSSLQNEVNQIWGAHQSGIMIGASVAAAALCGVAGLRALGKFGGAAERQAEVIAADKLVAPFAPKILSDSERGVASLSRALADDADSLHFRYYGSKAVPDPVEHRVWPRAEVVPTSGPAGAINETDPDPLLRSYLESLMKRTPKS